MQSTRLINRTIENTNSANPAIASSFEKACFNKGVLYLEHKTKIEYLPEILQSGFLIPRSQLSNPHVFMGGDGDVTYLTTYKIWGEANKYPCGENTIHDFSCSQIGMPPSIDGKTWYGHPASLDWYGGDKECALLLFDVKLLNDRRDYYANYELHYGVKDNESLTPELLTDTKLTPIDEISEICFKNPIDLSSYLKEIWVYPTEKDKVIDFLQKSRVSKSWVDKISAYEFFPKIEYEVRENSCVLKITPINKNGNFKDRNQYFKLHPTNNIFSVKKDEGRISSSSNSAKSQQVNSTIFKL